MLRSRVSRCGEIVQGSAPGEEFLSIIVFAWSDSGANMAQRPYLQYDNGYSEGAWVHRDAGGGGRVAHPVQRTSIFIHHQVEQIAQAPVGLAGLLVLIEVRLGLAEPAAQRAGLLDPPHRGPQVEVGRPGSVDQVLELRILEKIIEKEQPDAVLPTLGGQTGLNLAMELQEAGVLDAHGVELIGADAEAIETIMVDGETDTVYDELTDGRQAEDIEIMIMNHDHVPRTWTTV